MKEQLRQYKQTSPIIVEAMENSSLWRIIDGHKRYYAALQLGWSELEAQTTWQFSKEMESYYWDGGLP